MAEEPDLLISAGFSDAQLVREANKVVALYKKKGEEAQKAFVDAQGKVTNTQAARAHARELDRLSKAYDPVYRAAKQYENELKRLDRALDIGAISQKQYTAQVEQAAAALRRVQQPMDTVTQGGRRFGGALQNVGFQVGDFATQVGAGTSATQALGQQLPQLLGAFGTFGALAGAGAAIFIPLAAALFNMGDEAKTAEEKIEELSNVTDTYIDAAERAATPIDELREKYGELADEIQRVSGLQAAIAGEIAQNSLDAVVAEVAKSFGSPELLRQQATGRFYGPAGTVITKNLDELAKKFGVTQQQALELLDELEAVGDAKGPAEQIPALQALLEEMTRLAGGADALADKLPEVYTLISGALAEAGKRVEASVDEQTRTFQKLVDEYDKDTQELKKLSADRETAQKALDKAITDGSAEQVSALERVIEAQDKQIAKAKEQALENDAAFKKMGESIRNAIRSFATEALSPFTAAESGILDLIGQAEGTDKGRGYNETLGYGAFTGGPVNLTSMSLREVLALQKQILDHPNNPFNSSAVGRYQIVSKTLRGLIDELGLSMDEQFSPELQDRLAMQLVRRRQGQGVDGLRNEWEGLRNVPPAVIEAALGQQVIPSQDPEVAKSLKEEVKERERLAEQARKYGEQLAQNLLTQQQTAELERQRAEQIAAIEARGLSDQDEAAAIAAVNAEIEKQRTIMALLADAKRRNVDLDQQMTGSTMTYRQAIEALGETQRQQIITEQQIQAARNQSIEQAQFMDNVQDNLKNGLLDAIVAGESFADVLANVAQMLAKAALQAALFGDGPFGGGGGGLLSGLFGGFFGGFRASGGPVQPGKAYVVGEKGPEVIVPQSMGQVIPNGSLGGGSSMSYSPSIVVQGDANEKTLMRMEALLQRENDRFFSKWMAAQKQYGSRIA